MQNHIVVIASEYKGYEFLEEAQNAGWQTTLVTKKKLLDAAWPWTAIGDVRTVEDDAGHPPVSDAMPRRWFPRWDGRLGTAWACIHRWDAGV